jgi:hypothetical protein
MIAYQLDQWVLFIAQCLADGFLHEAITGQHNALFGQI